MPCCLFAPNKMCVPFQVTSPSHIPLQTLSQSPKVTPPRSSPFTTNHPLTLHIFTSKSITPNKQYIIRFRLAHIAPAVAVDVQSPEVCVCACVQTCRRHGVVGTCGASTGSLRVLVLACLARRARAAVGPRVPCVALAVFARVACCIHVCTDAYTHSQVQKHTREKIKVHVCVCLCVRARACVCVFTYMTHMLYRCIFIYTYIHIYHVALVL